MLSSMVMRSLFPDADRGIQIGKCGPQAGHPTRRCQPFGNARVIVDQPVQRHLDLNEGGGGLRQRAQA